MSTQRKRYSAEFKARVALEALKGLKTVQPIEGGLTHGGQCPHCRDALVSGDTLVGVEHEGAERG
jgi:hypothetical protein